MKAKLAIVTLVGLSACTLALAQNEPADSKPAEKAPAAAAPAPGATIPLIQFQDVPLTTAIDNLARQAGINYILDPKVGYGQPDERGQIIGSPVVAHGVIEYPLRELGLCAGISGAKYTTCACAHGPQEPAAVSNRRARSTRQPR